jgi:hypothetical protein
MAEKHECPPPGAALPRRGMMFVGRIQNCGKRGPGFPAGCFLLRLAWFADRVLKDEKFNE